MKYLSIIIASLVLASCSTTGMSSGDSMNPASGASGVNGMNSFSSDCSTNPPGLYCGD